MNKNVLETAVKKAIMAFKTVGVHSASFPSALMELQESVQHLTAENMGLHESMSGRIYPSRYPMTHIDVFESKDVSIGIFVLHSDPEGKIPLHDHPGMHGILKVIHGKVTVNTYTRDNIIVDSSKGVKYCAKKWPPLLVTSRSSPLIVSPHSPNIHSIDFTSGENNINYAAFVDFLSPPYYVSDSGPECNYYAVENDDDMIGNEDPSEDGSYFCYLKKTKCPSYYCNDNAAYCGPRVLDMIENQP